MEKGNQKIFNEVKGEISEIIISDDWCSVTILAGRSNPRSINFVQRFPLFSEALNGKNIGDTVLIRFYLASRKTENGRWYTNAHLISCYKS